MAKDEAEAFVKIVIDLPDAEDGVGGEGVWTVQVGPDLYEVRNSPWHTLEINYLDVVRAIAPSEDKKPVVTEVYRRGGHRSIHVVFIDASDEQKKEVLRGVNGFGANYENADNVLYAIDLPAKVSFDDVAHFLQVKEDEGWLSLRYAPQPQPVGTGEIIH